MPSPAAILPNSVRGPVATTTPRPLPACTTVPISAQPVSSASARAGRRPGRVSLSTGSDSPVSTDSSHSRPVAVEQPEVGRDDVAEPQLDEVAGHQVGHVDRGGARPSRMTTVSWWIWSCSASAAFSARYSLTKPSPTDSATITPMMTASLRSPTK